MILGAAIHGLDDGDAQNSSANESYGRDIWRARRSRAEGRNELRPVAIESQPRRHRPAQMRTVLQLSRPVGHDLGPRAMTLAATFCAGSQFNGDAQEMHRLRQRGETQFRCSCEVAKQFGWRTSTLGRAAAVKQLHGHRDVIRTSSVPHGEGELEAQVLASAFSDSLSESTGARHELSTRAESRSARSRAWKRTVAASTRLVRVVIPVGPGPLACTPSKPVKTCASASMEWW